MIKLGYLEPPPMSPSELLSAMDNLNTLLSIRLNIHEYDSLPPQFADYSIQSGRVTFHVKDEFEVDLTIADEDPEKQFWFLDFRFLFSPSVSSLAENMRFALETRVNGVLDKEGLLGCYRFLHEFTVTHKISELKRQAYSLTRSRWTETLKVESLHRAISIQYWTDRYGKDGPKSWVIIGVYSGKSEAGRSGEDEPSRIGLRWFRDSKEVTDLDITVDNASLDVEEILRTVISRHATHILHSIYSAVMQTQLFKNRALGATLIESTESTVKPELNIEVTAQHKITVMIEPITGLFAISPYSWFTGPLEHRLSFGTKDPAKDGHSFIEQMRAVIVTKEIVGVAVEVGWEHIQNVRLARNEAQNFLPKDTLGVAWFRRPWWNANWYLVLSSSMSGERWWLFHVEDLAGSAEGGNHATGIATLDGPKITKHMRVPVKMGVTVPSYRFLSSLSVFAAAMVAFKANEAALQLKRATYQAKRRLFPISQPLSCPDIHVVLSTILPSRNKSQRTGMPWAKDKVIITLQGLETETVEAKIAEKLASPSVQPEGHKPSAATSQEPKGRVIFVARGQMEPSMSSGLLVNQPVDKDMTFNPSTGEFAFRLTSNVAESILEPLIERLQRIERVVDFVQVISLHDKTLHCDSISLTELVFSYGGSIEDSQALRHAVTVTFSTVGSGLGLSLAGGNPHIRIYDFLQKVLNSSLGLDALAHGLIVTLPLMKAFDAIELGYSDNGSGARVYIFARTLDWYTMRYVVPYSALDAPRQIPQQEKKIEFDIRLKHRAGIPWWRIHRIRIANTQPDDVDAKLKDSVWSQGHKDGWRGMDKSAVARIFGAEAMIMAVNEVMQEVVNDPKALGTIGLPLVAPDLADTSTQNIKTEAAKAIPPQPPAKMAPQVKQQSVSPKLTKKAAAAAQIQQRAGAQRRQQAQAQIPQMPARPLNLQPPARMQMAAQMQQQHGAGQMGQAAQRNNQNQQQPGNRNNGQQDATIVID
jgi:mediator of RNA polymerase II transcription subunit 14